MKKEKVVKRVAPKEKPKGKIIATQIDIEKNRNTVIDNIKKNKIGVIIPIW